MAADCKMKTDTLQELYWDKGLSIAKIATLYNVRPSTIFKRMEKSKIVRRSLSESTNISNQLKPKFLIKGNLSDKEKELKIAGLML